MNKEELRKCKWIVGHKFYLKGEEISKRKYEDLSFNDEEVFQEANQVDCFEEGYFHEWIVNNYGNSHDGIYTEVYALVEKMNGKVIQLDTDEIIFIDEFKDVISSNLKQLIGKSIQNNSFIEVLDFIKLLSSNELIQKYILDIVKGFENNSLVGVLKVADELFDSKGNEELLKEVVKKYNL